MTPKHKALEKKKVGDASVALKHHQALASKEKKDKAPFIKKFGSFEDRLKKYSAWQKKLNQAND